MDTNERLQQALDELAVAAARLNESAIQLRCVFSDEARKSMAYGAANQGSVPVNRLDALARFNGVAQEAHDKALIHALRDVNDSEVADAQIKWEQMVSDRQFSCDEMFREILRNFLVSRHPL